MADMAETGRKLARIFFSFPAFVFSQAARANDHCCNNMLRLAPPEPLSCGEAALLEEGGESAFKKQTSGKTRSRLRV